VLGLVLNELLAVPPLLIKDFKRLDKAPVVFLSLSDLREVVVLESLLQSVVVVKD
jgi:hypothetical protein